MKFFFNPKKFILDQNLYIVQITTSYITDSESYIKLLVINMIIHDC